MIIEVIGKVLKIDERMSQSQRDYAYIKIREAYRHYELNLVAFGGQIDFFRKDWYVKVICFLRANDFGSNSLTIASFVDCQRKIKDLKEANDTDFYDDDEHKEF